MKQSEEPSPAVYIIANKPRGRLYIGVTTHLHTQVELHKDGSIPGPARRYGLNSLVWYEHHESMEIARWRQKRIKALYRDWKIFMIEKANPGWIDLHEQINLDVKYRGPGPLSGSRVH